MAKPTTRAGIAFLRGGAKPLRSALLPPARHHSQCTKAGQHQGVGFGFWHRGTHYIEGQVRAADGAAGAKEALIGIARPGSGGRPTPLRRERHVRRHRDPVGSGGHREVTKGQRVSADVSTTRAVLTAIAGEGSKCNRATRRPGHIGVDVEDKVGDRPRGPRVVITAGKGDAVDVARTRQCEVIVGQGELAIAAAGVVLAGIEIARPVVGLRVQGGPARVKVVVASFMQPTAV